MLNVDKYPNANQHKRKDNKHGLRMKLFVTYVSNTYKRTLYKLNE